MRRGNSFSLIYARRESLGGSEYFSITVVYGANGSGKSSYVRLLKHVCEARHPGSLLHNVFKPEKNIQQARIGFKKDGEGKEVTWSRKDDEDKEVTWSRKEAREELTSVNIFDHTYGGVFVDKDDKVLYEPPELASIRSLIEICDQVTGKLGAEEREHPSKKPLLPYDYKDSKEGKWFEGINAKTSEKDIKKYCTFSGEDEKRLERLRSPKVTVENLENKQRAIGSILNDAQRHLQQLSDDACKQIILLHSNYIVKKEAAKAAAEKVFSDNILKDKGIGSDTWQELWEAARKYSQAEAYKEREFPVVEGDDAVCVLCHQSLPKDVRDRFNAFESYVKESTQEKAAEAQKNWQKAVQETLENTSDIPKKGPLNEEYGERGVDNSNVRESLLRLYTALRGRREKLSALKSESEIPPMPNRQCIEDIKNIGKTHEQGIKKYSQEVNKDLLISLEARKWLSKNRTAIEEEIDRLRYIGKIQKAKELIKINMIFLSKWKGRAAEELITAPFVKWFNEELKALNARVKVEIQYTRTKKGEVLHELVLVGVRLDVAKKNLLKKVLSEGEKKVVSIAAFLADIKGNKLRSPIVFDDPTSSFDQDFEKAFAEKLCELSNERQVIVFTHRLPLLVELEDQAEQKVDIKHIKKNGQISGEPEEVPLWLLNTRNTLESLLKRIEEKDSIDSVYITGLYTEFRNLLERVVENDLLLGIVRRGKLRMQIDKLPQLVAIEEEDIKILHKFYQQCCDFLHSPSPERAGPSSNRGDLRKNFEKLQGSLKKLKERRKGK